MFCFGLQSIPRFEHQHERELTRPSSTHIGSRRRKIFLKLLNLSRKKKCYSPEVS